MRNVTGEEVKQACLEAGLHTIPHHECGICRSMTCYYVEDGNLYFDSRCDCNSLGRVEQRDWSDAAEWINMQTREESRASLMARFGFRTLTNLHTGESMSEEMIAVLRRMKAEIAAMPLDKFHYLITENDSELCRQFERTINKPPVAQA